MIKSGFIPRFIGYWLLIDGLAYVVLSVIGIMAPQYHERAFLIAQPALFGELVIMLFLLIRGANSPTPRDQNERFGSAESVSGSTSAIARWR